MKQILIIQNNLSRQIAIAENRQLVDYDIDIIWSEILEDLSEEQRQETTILIKETNELLGRDNYISGFGGTNKTLLKYLNSSVDSIVVDNKTAQQDIIALLSEKMPQYVSLVTLYQEKTPLFKKYGVDKQVDNLGKENQEPIGNRMNTIQNVTESVIKTDMTEKATSSATSNRANHTHLMNKSHRSPIERGSGNSAMGLIVLFVVIAVLLFVFSGN